MDQRRGRRDNTDVAVRFVALPATIGAGRVTNISLSGAFMETKCKLPMRTVIHIEGLESGREHGGKPDAAKRLAAMVVRRCSAGVGLEWCTRPSRATLEFPLDTPLPADDHTDPVVYHLQFID